MDFTMRSKIFHFNPRSREGSDAITAQELPRLDGISIHAPAKGATSLVLKGTQRKIISIHAPAKGATYRTTQKLRELQFQSTLPRRERRGSHTNLIEWISFQSTLPRRERQITELYKMARILFQSTLPRRERRYNGKPDLPLLYNFNPRSREGSDTKQNE